MKPTLDHADQTTEAQNLYAFVAHILSHVNQHMRSLVIHAISQAIAQQGHVRQTTAGDCTILDILKLAVESQDSNAEDVEAFTTSIYNAVNGTLYGDICKLFSLVALSRQTPANDTLMRSITHNLCDIDRQMLPLGQQMLSAVVTYHAAMKLGRDFDLTNIQYIISHIRGIEIQTNLFVEAAYGILQYLYIQASVNKDQDVKITLTKIRDVFGKETDESRAMLTAQYISINQRQYEENSQEFWSQYARIFFDTKFQAQHNSSQYLSEVRQILQELVNITREEVSFEQIDHIIHCSILSGNIKKLVNQISVRIARANPDQLNPQKLIQMGEISTQILSEYLTHPREAPIDSTFEALQDKQYKAIAQFVNRQGEFATYQSLKQNVTATFKDSVSQLTAQSIDMLATLLVYLLCRGKPNMDKYITIVPSKICEWLHIEELPDAAIEVLQHLYVGDVLNTRASPFHVYEQLRTTFAGKVSNAVKLLLAARVAAQVEAEQLEQFEFYGEIINRAQFVALYNKFCHSVTTEHWLYRSICSGNLDQIIHDLCYTSSDKTSFDRKTQLLNRTVQKFKNTEPAASSEAMSEQDAQDSQNKLLATLMQEILDTTKEAGYPRISNAALQALLAHPLTADSRKVLAHMLLYCLKHESFIEMARNYGEVDLSSKFMSPEHVAIFIDRTERFIDKIPELQESLQRYVAFWFTTAQLNDHLKQVMLIDPNALYERPIDLPEMMTTIKSILSIETPIEASILMQAYYMKVHSHDFESERDLWTAVGLSMFRQFATAAQIKELGQKLNQNNLQCAPALLQTGHIDEVVQYLFFKHSEIVATAGESPTMIKYKSVCLDHSVIPLLQLLSNGSRLIQQLLETVEPEGNSGHFAEASALASPPSSPLEERCDSSELLGHYLFHKEEP